MNNLPEGFLENRLQELLADDDIDALRASVTPPAPSRQHGQAANFDQPSAVRRPVNFDQPSAVRRPVSFDQPSAQRMPPPKPIEPLPLNHPALSNFDEPSGRRAPNSAVPNFNQPSRPPQRPGPNHLDQARQPNNVRPNFDQTSRPAQGRRVSFDTPSRVQQKVPATQRMPQSNGMDWSSSLLNSISTYDEKSQPDTAELLQGALEALTDAVIITDCNGRLIWVNRYASELLDMPATSLMGTPATAVFGKYAAAFVPAELILLAPSGRLNDWQINLLLPSAIRRSMVFNFALTRRNGEQVVVAIGHEYREATPPVAVPNAPITQRSNMAHMAERITVRLRPETEMQFPVSAPPPPPMPARVPDTDELEPRLITQTTQAERPLTATQVMPAIIATPVATPVATTVAAPVLVQVAPVAPVIVAPVSELAVITPSPAIGIEHRQNAAIPELMTFASVIIEEAPSVAPTPEPVHQFVPNATPPVAVAAAPLEVVAAPLEVVAAPLEVVAASLEEVENITATGLLREAIATAADSIEFTPTPFDTMPPVTAPAATVAPVVVAPVVVAPPEPVAVMVEPVAAPVVAAQISAASAAPATVEPAENTAAQFWQFLEFAPEPMMVTDHRGRIVQLNGLAEEMFGYDRTEMLGEKALALLAKQSRDAQQPRFPFGVTETSLNGISEIVEVHGWHREGAEFPLELTRRQTEDGQFVVLTLRPVALNPSVPTEAAPALALTVTEAPPQTPIETQASAAPETLPETSPETSGTFESHSPSLVLRFNEHLRRHNRALGELSRSTAWAKKGLGAALSEITAVAAQALDTARVSVWLYNEARTEIFCQDLFEAVDERHSQGTTIAAEDFPRYFAALAADRTIAAHDAHFDERTAEFSASYLTPNGITSMLDAPIRALGRTIGVVCLEHIGTSRQWTPEDETFAASVADFVAMAYEADERQAAQASQARLAAVLQATPDCVSITNAFGRLSFLNAAGRRLVERTQGEDISDLVISDLYSPEAYAQLEDEILPAAWQNSLWTGETTLRRADGSAMPVAQITFIQTNDEQQIEFIAHIHHDLTERKRLEEERSAVLEHEKQLRRSAEEHVQQKDDFLSTVSHELRTPLTGIVGWIELIRSGTLDDDEMERAIATIERDAHTQMKLVDDLLDASRAISDKLTIDERPLELMNVVAAALDTVRPQIEEKDIKLNISFQPWVGPFVGDASRLQQVVWNLLANAVKFTPTGGTIEVALARNQTHALILVRDSGIGITPEFLPHLFERFRQQDGSTQRRYGGLGLGLAIAKHIVELHQGTIVAHSAGTDQGTEFVVTLPLAAAQPAPAAAPKITGLADKLNKSPQQRPPLLAGVRVLAIDDQPGARDLFRTVLTQYQAEVHLASSAAEARQLLTTWRPHVIVSDIGMPGEDGCEMMRHIRALAPEHGGQTPAIALTAYVSEQDRARALQAGFNAHLAKPVNPEELVNTVAQLMNPLRQAVERLSNSGSLNESAKAQPLQ